VEGTVNEDYVLGPLTAAAFTRICVVRRSHECVMTIGVGARYTRAVHLAVLRYLMSLIGQSDSLCKSFMTNKAGIAF
jgi:hypothetical protein